MLRGEGVWHKSCQNRERPGEARGWRRTLPPITHAGPGRRPAADLGTGAKAGPGRGRERRHTYTPDTGPRTPAGELDRHARRAGPAISGPAPATLDTGKPATGRPANIGLGATRSPGNRTPGILAPPRKPAPQRGANYHRQGRPPRRDAAGNRPPSSDRRKPINA